MIKTSPLFDKLIIERKESIYNAVKDEYIIVDDQHEEACRVFGILVWRRKYDGKNELSKAEIQNKAPGFRKG